MKGLAEAPRGGQVVQTLAPGVHELLAELTGAVGEGLLPLLKGIGRKIKGTEAAQDRTLTTRLDKALKSLDQLNELAASLKKIDTRGLAAE